MKKTLMVAVAAAAMMALAGGASAKTPAKHSAATKASAHATVSKDPARLGGKPNLNGIWQVMNTANWDLEPHDAQEASVSPEKVGAIGAVPPGLGVVEGGTIPYLPDALKQREENRKSAPMADPEAKCYLPGIPRATYADNMPFQIIQGDDGDMQVVYQYAAANRVIFMKKAEEPPIDTWMGTSYGQWEGDTLTVTTLGQNGMTWLDRKGDFLSSTAKVTEHFKMLDHDHIAYDATIEDASTYSRPWKMSMILYRRVEQNAEILDFRCVPFADLLIYGDLLQNKDAK